MTTITLTEPTAVAQQRALTLRLRPPTQGIEGLMERMLSSEAFSVSTQSQIRTWGSTWSRLENNGDKATALFYLLYTTLHPALIAPENGDKIELLFDLEDEIKHLLRTFLPAEKDVDTFIEERSARQIVIDRIAAVEWEFKRVTDHVYDSSNRTNHTMATTFDQLKARLVETTKEAQTKSEDLRKKTASLLDRAEQAQKKAQDMASSAVTVGKALNAQQQSMRNIITQSSDLS